MSRLIKLGGITKEFLERAVQFHFSWIENYRLSYYSSFRAVLYESLFSFVFVSVTSNKEAKTIQSVKKLLKTEGYNLRKFITKNHVIRKSSVDNYNKQEDVTLDRNTPTMERTLGVL